MTLSAYPLLVWQQDWTPSAMMEKNGSYRIFGEDVSEGIYIAARHLLIRSSDDPIVPITSYGSPPWDPTVKDTKHAHLAAWVSVIGHRQFWPIAVLRKGVGISESLPAFPNGDATPLRISAELKVLVLLGVIWSLLHLLWCLRGSVLPTTAAFRLACFAPLARKQHPFLVAIGSLLPAFAAVV